MVKYFKYLFTLFILLYANSAYSADCYQYWNHNIPVPAGFASSYNVFNPTQQLISVGCNSPPNITLIVGTEDSTTQAIYNTVYLSKDGGTTWTPITLVSTHKALSTNYFEASAAAALNITASELENNWNYIAFLVAYKRGDGTYIYGCADSACTSAVGWNLQAVTTGTITPEAVAISLSPSSSTIAVDAPPGTVVSTATVTMSDGSAFGGTLSVTGTDFLAPDGNRIVLQRVLTSGDVGTYTVTVAVP